MSDIVGLIKAVSGTDSGIPAESSQRLPDRAHQSHKKFRSEAIVIVEAVNNTGVKLTAFQCVALDDGPQALSIPYAIFPTASDDPELTQYGSVLEDALPNGVCHVQVSGPAFFQIYQSNSAKVLIGEILYAMDNKTGKAGMVVNKASGDPDIISKIPLGRCLQDQATDSSLLRINLSGPGGSSTQNVDFADIMTNGILTFADPNTPSGIVTPINGLTCADGTIVLLKDQTVFVNGLWTMHSGSWSKIGATKLVVVNIKVTGTPTGTIYIPVLFYLSTSNTYQFLYPTPIHVKGATTAASGLSGTGTIDTNVALQIGDLVLVKNQTPANAAQNGVYIVMSGTWIKIGQPDMVFVNAGTLSAKTTYLLTSSNTYNGMNAFFG